MKVPDRWLNYTNSARIKDTRFVAFKVPLRKGYCNTLPRNKSFEPGQILEEFPKLKLVIDLTYTDKYYDGRVEFEEKGVRYEKLKCPGHQIPPESIFKKFVEIVNDFIANNPQDYLIGVHCTHGVNRTGYLIVRYMIEKLGYTPQQALRDFFESRGHAIERTDYRADLMVRIPHKR